MKKGLFFLLMLVAFSFAGCDSALLNETKEIPNSVWTYDNGLGFEFDITDVTKHYDLILEVNHSTEYPFQNLYLKIVTTYPSGKAVDDILSINLADKSGKWYGDCNGTACKTIIDLQKNTIFKETGKHVITFFQNTRTENLEGVSGLGFVVREVGK